MMSFIKWGWASQRVVSSAPFPPTPTQFIQFSLSLWYLAAAGRPNEKELMQIMMTNVMIIISHDEVSFVTRLNQPDLFMKPRIWLLIPSSASYFMIPLKRLIFRLIIVRSSSIQIYKNSDIFPGLEVISWFRISYSSRRRWKFLWQVTWKRRW